MTTDINKFKIFEEPEENDLKVVYIVNIGVDSDGLNVYHFLLSDDSSETFTEEWAEKPSSNIPNDLLLIDKSQFEYVKELKTDIKLDLAQDNTCFSLQDCRDHIVALAYENLDEAEEYPEPIRIVIHFGEPIKEVEEKLLLRNLRMKFV